MTGGFVVRLLCLFLTTFWVSPVGAQISNSAPFASFDLASDPVLNDPHDLEVGLDGRLYIADKFGARIVIMDPDTLEVVDILGEGALPGVHDISINALGTTVIAVTGVSVAAVYSDVANAGKQPDLALSAPRTEGALAHSNGRIYAMASGLGVLAAFEGSTLIATASGHGGAHDVAEDPQGNVWVADNAARRLVKYSPDLKRILVLDHEKFGFMGPRYLDFDDFGRLVVADQDAHRILLIDPDGPDGGTLLGVLGDGQPGLGVNKFDDPEGVVVLGNRYYISDSDNNRIVRYSVVLN
ncbi:MAG: NHL repeat-containing protein [Marinosulfonomonas sp.]|nr:NHL repeat-containing protein [Marinosulfonomonas sp.]